MAVADPVQVAELVEAPAPLEPVQALALRQAVVQELLRARRVVVVKVAAPTVSKVAPALKAAPEQTAARAVASKAAGLVAVVVAAWAKPGVMATAMAGAVEPTIVATVTHASS